MRSSVVDKWPFLAGAGVLVGAALALFEEAVSQRAVGFGLFLLAAVLVGAAIAQRDDDDAPDDDD